jgi:hypothetical protein
MLEPLRQEIETLPIEDQEQVLKFILILKKKQKPIQYRTQAFKELLQQIQPVSSNFDPDQAKWEYLQEKYNL